MPPLLHAVCGPHLDRLCILCLSRPWSREGKLVLEHLAGPHLIAVHGDAHAAAAGRDLGVAAGGARRLEVLLQLVDKPDAAAVL